MVDLVIDVDGGFVERLLLGLARHGGYGQTGVWRTAYSPEWAAAQHQVAAWPEEAGLDVRATRSAMSEEGWPAARTGRRSPPDRTSTRRPRAAATTASSAPPPGWSRWALRERFATPRRTLEAVSLCEEEASRFHATNFWGSRAIIGAISPDEPDQIRDRGVSFRSSRDWTRRPSNASSPRRRSWSVLSGRVRIRADDPGRACSCSKRSGRGGGARGAEDRAGAGRVHRRVEPAGSGFDACRRGCVRRRPCGASRSIGPPSKSCSKTSLGSRPRCSASSRSASLGGHARLMTEGSRSRAEARASTRAIDNAHSSPSWANCSAPSSV
jgi:hypothetical protein